MKLTAEIEYQTLNLLILEVSRKMLDGFDCHLFILYAESKN